MGEEQGEGRCGVLLPSSFRKSRDRCDYPESSAFETGIQKARGQGVVAEKCEKRGMTLRFAPLLLDNLWVITIRPGVAEVICHLIRDRRDAGKFTAVTSDLPMSKWMERNPKIGRLLAEGTTIRLTWTVFQD